MKIGLGLYRQSLTDDNFRFARQAGATHIVAHLTNYFRGKNPSLSRGDDVDGWGDCAGDRLWTYEEFADLVAAARRHDLEIGAIENLSPAFWSDVLLGGPGRKEQIEGVKTLVRDAGRAGIPQIVSIGCYDLVDLVGWHEMPDHLRDRPAHAHNRLLTSVIMTPEERREMARVMCDRLAQARAPVVFLLPTQGGNEWDRPGGPLSDPQGLAAFVQGVRDFCPGNVTLIEMDAHINDPLFSDTALAVVDDWIAEGTLPR